MRIEPYTIGSIIHVVKRGARGMDICLDESDKWKFVKSLYILNDVYQSENWHRETAYLPLFERPDHWPPREPLVRILAWTLLPNHFHLLLQETKEGGVAKFIKRIGVSMTMCFNSKYENKGSIFQGAYRSRIVDNDHYFRYLLFYIQVKNVLELYPGGLAAALEDFDRAWVWAIGYPFSSLSTYARKTQSFLISDDEGLLSGSYDNRFKEESFKVLRSYVDLKSEFRSGRFKELALE